MLTVAPHDSMSDLMEQLDAMASAQPLDAEDDLILRMSAVSKVRNSKREKKGKAARSSLSPSKVGGIKKKEKRRKVQGMVVDQANQRPSVTAAAAANAVLDKPGLRPRSNSI